MPSAATSQPPSPPLIFFPPPGVRISPKCRRSLTRMFNSFQKHRKAICQRQAQRCSASPPRCPEAAGPAAPLPSLPAARCPLPAAAARPTPRRSAPLRAGPDRAARDEPSCAASSARRAFRTHVGAGSTNSAPLAHHLHPPQVRVYSESQLLPPFILYYLPSPPLSQAVKKARLHGVAQSCCCAGIEPGLPSLAGYAKWDWPDQLENYLFMKCLAAMKRAATIMNCCLDNWEGLIGSFYQ